MNFKKYDRRQAFLLPPSLQELIPPGDLVYFIVEVIDQLDLRPLYKKYDPLGQNAYHPAMLLGLLFYAACQGIWSSRKIAAQLTESARFMYLAGMQTPDFRTIADFRKNNLQLIQAYFTRIVFIAQELGLVTLREVAVDGSKIAASASSKQNKNREQIAKQLSEVEAEIARLLAYAQNLDREEDKAASAPNPALEQLKDLQTLRSKLRQAKELLEANSSQKTVNLTDPDCRQQLKTGPGYNAQIAVDAQSQFIVYNEVVSDPNDNDRLVPMVEGMEAATDTIGHPKQIEADSGYASAKAFRELQVWSHLDVYVPTQQQVKRKDKPVPFFDKSNFTFDLHNLTAKCPLNCEMRYLRSGINESGEAYVNFLGTQCPDCPAKFLCTKAQFRNLVVLKAQPLIDKMEKKMASPAGRKAMLQRKQSVEPVFGTIKEQLNFRRFHLRGKEKASGEFALACIGFNLKKLHKWVGSGGLAGALAAVSAQIRDFSGNFVKSGAFCVKELIGQAFMTLLLKNPQLSLR